MSSMAKILLLLVAMVCISTAQFHESGRCLCRRVRNNFTLRSGVKDIKIHKENNFCNKLEIVVTLNNGHHFCLNPKLKNVEKILTRVLSNERSSTSSPADVSSTSGSSSTTNM